MRITRAVVPSLFTVLNMFCGFLSIIHTAQNDFSTAAWFIILAGICDVLDGMMARVTRSFSDFGVEFDSLSERHLLRSRALISRIHDSPPLAGRYRGPHQLVSAGVRSDAVGAIQRPARWLRQGLFQRSSDPGGRDHDQRICVNVLHGGKRVWRPRGVAAALPCSRRFVAHGEQYQVRQLSENLAPGNYAAPVAIHRRRCGPDRDRTHAGTGALPVLRLLHRDGSDTLYCAIYSTCTPSACEQCG